MNSKKHLILLFCSFFILPYSIVMAYEIRKYSDRLAVETSRAGIDSNFRKLFNYISGRNDAQEKIAMTTPVTQVEKNGNICVGTLFNGGISVISPSGDLVEFIKFEDPYITNICFGSKDLKTAYITASYQGHLLEVQWGREGLPLNFLNK